MVYKSNMDDAINSIAVNLEGLKDHQKLKADIAQALLTSNLKRIHHDGQDVNNRRIGRYSTKPTFIGRTSFTANIHANKVLGSKAKRKKLQWRNIRGRNLAILPGGYKEIRKIEGRKINFVNLQRTGKLMRSFMILSRGKVWTLGLDAYGAEISEWLEDKYSTKIWGVSKDDTKEINQIIAWHVNDAL